jgi:hypothetical protein
MSRIIKAILDYLLHHFISIKIKKNSYIIEEKIKTGQVIGREI